MRCRICSQLLPADALFCGDCGQAVSGPALATAQARPITEPAHRLSQRNRRAPTGDGDGSSCEECGAAVSSSDIFCGECGHVSASVSAAFSRAGVTSIIDSIRVSPPEDPAEGTPAAPAPGVAATVDPPPGPDADGDADVDADAADVDADEGADEAEAGGDETDSTDRGAAAATDGRFVLQFSTGESVTVSGTGLVGRNPVSEPGEYFDHMVRVLDSTRSVSRIHLEFGQHAGVFWVSDRYSGNGTIVRAPDRAAVRCEPGKRQVVQRGARVVIGEQFFVVS